MNERGTCEGAEAERWEARSVYEDVMDALSRGNCCEMSNLSVDCNHRCLLSLISNVVFVCDLGGVSEGKLG